LEELLAFTFERAAATHAERGSALLCAGRGNLDEAFDATGRALAHHARIDQPFDRARTLLVLGSIQRRTKRKRAARDALEEAQSVFERLDAPIWARRASEEAARIGGRTRSSQLTAGEEAVARLAAEGRSNPEIAAALFLSRQTVEKHLSKVYAKLGIRSRAELARRWTE
ncbi:MAG: response regulator transcription factor, partial [Actinomycetota bacterium]